MVELSISGIATHAKQFEMSKVYLNKNLILPKQSFNKNVILGINTNFAKIRFDNYSDVQPKMIISLIYAFLTVPIEVSRMSAINGLVIVKIGKCFTTKRKALHDHRIKHNNDKEMKEIMCQYFEIDTCGVKPAQIVMS